MKFETSKESYHILCHLFDNWFMCYINYLPHFSVKYDIIIFNIISLISRDNKYYFIKCQIGTKVFLIQRRKIIVYIYILTSRRTSWRHDILLDSL